MKKIIFFLVIIFSLCSFSQDGLYVMNKKFNGENLRANVVNPNLSGENFVKYFSKTEAQQFKVVIKNGLISINGEVYTNPIHSNRQSFQKAIFVMSAENEIYISSQAKENIFHHSSFVSGKPIKYAGEIIVNEGKIVALNSRSGHYTPVKNESSILMARALEEAGYEHHFPVISEILPYHPSFPIELHRKSMGVFRTLNTCNPLLKKSPL